MKQAEIVGSGKNPTTPLCNETTKHKTFFDERMQK